MTYIDKARQVLEIERDGIRRISEQLDGRFDQLVEACLDTLAKRGKIVLSGVGKSGQISQKLASTLSSTGSRACFLHPVEAMHGRCSAGAGASGARFNASTRVRGFRACPHIAPTHA